MPSRVDIGWIGDDQVVAPAADRLEQVAPMQRHPVFQTVIGNVARGDGEGVSGKIDRVDTGIGKRTGREHRETA